MKLVERLMSINLNERFQIRQIIVTHIELVLQTFLNSLFVLSRKAIHLDGFALTDNCCDECTEINLNGILIQSTKKVGQRLCILQSRLKTGVLCSSGKSFRKNFLDSSTVSVFLIL